MVASDSHVACAESHGLRVISACKGPLLLRLACMCWPSRALHNFRMQRACAYTSM